MDSLDCPYCAAQLPREPAQAGQQTVCPSCNRPFHVPAIQPADFGDEYELADDRDHRVAPPPVVATLIEQDAEEFEEDEEDVRRPAMEWNIFLGGFGFPWTRGAVIRWILLSLWAVIPLWLARSAIGLGIGGQLPGGGGLAVIGSVVGGVITGLGAIVFGTVATAVAAIHGLTILSETSEGNDRIESWPNLLAFLEWIGSLFYVINAAALCVALGFGLAWLTPGAGAWVVGLTVFFLFPILLLCELEANSAFLPVSALVLASLGRHCIAWLLFYLESSILLSVAGTMVALVAAKIDDRLAVIVAALLIAAVVMIYFRLLGRLAWFCSVETDDEMNDTSRQARE